MEDYGFTFKSTHQQSTSAGLNSCYCAVILSNLVSTTITTMPCRTTKTKTCGYQIRHMFWWRY